MTNYEAFEIVHIWGDYIEYCHDRLFALFMAHIPESLLPYPLETIEEALNIIAKHYHVIGDYENSKLLKDSINLLTFYEKDDEALKMAAWTFKLPEVKESIISNMKKVQKNWIKTQIK